MKKLLFILTIILIITVVSGCGNESATSKGIDKEASTQPTDTTVSDALCGDGTYAVSSDSDLDVDDEGSSSSSEIHDKYDKNESVKKPQENSSSSSKAPENNESTSASLPEDDSDVESYEAEIDFSELK